MEGWELYELYVKYSEKEFIRVDSWEELDSNDQRVWNNMAEEIGD